MTLFHLLLIVVLSVAIGVFQIDRITGMKECRNGTLMIHDGGKWVFHRGSDGGFVACK